MRTLPILQLTAGLTLVGCDDNPPTGEPLPDGTLVVSTSTMGEDPDPDGFLLTVDDVDSLYLSRQGSAEIDVPAGRHTLRLLGVAAQCSVAPGTPLDIDVVSGNRRPVTFEVTCPATGARVTAGTTGLDLDPDGYRLVVDGAGTGHRVSVSPLLVRLEPGIRTLALTDVAANCAVQGSQLYTVTIVGQEVAPVDFMVACTATTGVIQVDLEGNGTGEEFMVILDGAAQRPVRQDGRPSYFEYVTGGPHVISLSGPSHCSVEGDSQAVTVGVGSAVRDTVQVTFSVTCSSGTAGIRISTPTTGPVQPGEYYVFLCTDPWCDSWPSAFGQVALNDTIVLQVDPGKYWVYYSAPSNCLRELIPENPIELVSRAVVDVAFRVTCT